MSKKRVPLTPERIAQLRACACIKVHDAEVVYGIGRQRLYDFMKDGRVKFVKIGASTLLRVDSLEALVYPVEAAE